MLLTMLGGNRDTQDCEGRRIHTSSRGDWPFRWCFGGPPVPEQRCSGAINDTWVVTESGPGERTALFWDDEGKPHTINYDQPEGMSDEEYLERLLQLLAEAELRAEDDRTG